MAMKQQQQVCENDNNNLDGTTAETLNQEEVGEGGPMKNLCVICGVDMGDCNPRQLCGKTRCYEDDKDHKLSA